MQRAFYVILLAALCCAACTPPTNNATAQTATSPAATDQAAAPRQRYWVTVVQVKPEMVPQYREFAQKVTLPAYQKAGFKQQTVYTTALLGESFEFVYFRPIESLQFFDEPSFLIKALGEEGARGRPNAPR